MTYFTQVDTRLAAGMNPSSNYLGFIRMLCYACYACYVITCYAKGNNK